MKFLKKYRDKIIILISWMFIFLVTVTISALLLYYSVFKAETKKVNILNFYNEDIRVEINNDSYNVKAFDILNVDYKLKGDLLIKAYKGDSIVYQNDLKSLGLRPKFLSIVLSHEADTYCFYQTNLTDYFKGNSTENLFGNSTNFYAKNNAFIFDVDETKNIYIFAGQNELPQSTHKNIIGIYPIVCKDMPIADVRESTFKFYQSYNPQEQRDFLETKRQQIEQSGSVDEVNGL